MTSSNGKYDVELTITLTEAPGAVDYEFVLLGSGGAVSEGSTLPDPRAALAAVEQFGEEIFFPVPRPDRICTQQYGGPQVATVTGRFRGREVSSRFWISSYKHRLTKDNDDFRHRKVRRRTHHHADGGTRRRGL